MAQHEDGFVKSFLRPVPFTQGEVSSYDRERQELSQARR
jgi:hypothetical protein